jgi:hypothetical protein
MNDPYLREVMKIGKEADRMYRKAIHKQQNDNAIILGLCMLMAALLLLLAVVAQADEIDLDKWANAIFKAEGGYGATYLYGIRSIPYDTEEEARRICKNTVYRTLVKYRATRCNEGESDINCMARRYCPINSDTDNGTCQYWKRNVLALMEE